MAVLYAEQPVALHAPTETVYCVPVTLTEGTPVALVVCVLHVVPPRQYWKV